VEGDKTENQSQADIQNVLWQDVYIAETRWEPPFYR
jgi:hypothetical protein